MRVCVRACVGIRGRLPVWQTDQCNGCARTGVSTVAIASTEKSAHAFLHTRDQDGVTATATFACACDGPHCSGHIETIAASGIGGRREETCFPGRAQVTTSNNRIDHRRARARTHTHTHNTQRMHDFYTVPPLRPVQMRASVKLLMTRFLSVRPEMATGLSCQSITPMVVLVVEPARVKEEGLGQLL